jgi:hypothetical protein
MEPTAALPGSACAPRLDCAVPVRAASPELAMGIPPNMSGFERTSADEAAILSILRVLHQSDEPRVLSGVERAFVIAGRTLFSELAAICEGMLERTKAAREAPLNPPPKPKSPRQPKPPVTPNG